MELAVGVWPWLVLQVAGHNAVMDGASSRDGDCVTNAALTRDPPRPLYPASNCAGSVTLSHTRRLGPSSSRWTMVRHQTPDT